MNTLRFGLVLFFGMIFGLSSGNAQEYLRMIDSGDYPVQQVMDSAEAYFENRSKGRGTGFNPYNRWVYNAKRMVKDNGYLPRIDERISELERWNAEVNHMASNRTVLSDSWEDLGPSYWNATSGWNPGVGRLTGLAIEEGNMDHMIVGANTGGVWRTTDGAQTWNHLTDYFSHLAVYSVAIHPNDPDTYYFGSQAGKIFKSTDAGATWEQLGPTGNSQINRILINPDNPDIMFATAENAGIYRTVNGGVTWTQAVTDSRGFDVVFKPGDLSVVYASGTRFHKSTDGGMTFTTIGGMQNGPKMIGVSEADPERVLVLEANEPIFGALYTSSDSGDSFSKFNHGSLNFFGYSTSGMDGNGQAPRDMAIAINPENANEVHIAGILTWRSMDGGANFTITSDWIPQNAAAQNIGYCHADVDDLMFYGTTLYAVTDGGIFKAENTGTINADYFEDMTTGLSIRQFYKIGIAQTEDLLVSGGSQDNGTSFYTEASGWKDWLGADGMETFIDKDNTDIFYGTTQFGNLYRSVNGGNSYYNLPSPRGKSGNWVTPFEQDPILPNTVYVGYDVVYKSVNGGSGWSPISQTFSGNLSNLKVAQSNSNVMYASQGALVFKTIDGGATDWQRMTVPGGIINSIAIHPANPNKVAIATTSSKRVLVSEDGGETWSDYRKNLPDFSSLALVWDDNGQDGLYLGMDYGVYYIDNTFEEWQPYNNLLPNVIINELEINKTTGMIYAGTYGRGLWASPVVSPTVGIGENTFEQEVKVYPNPAVAEVNITMPYKMTGELRMFDITGKLLKYERKAIFENTYTLDVSSIPAGVYFIRLNTSEGVAVKKLIVE